MKKHLILTCCTLFVAFSSFALLPLTGTMGACVGGTTHLNEFDSLAGSTWSSSNTAIASVAAIGVSSTGTCSVTGISAGIAIITYWQAGSYVTASFTVNAAPASITGATPTCIGVSTTLSDATPGGAWSSGDPSIATVDPATGVVTGVHGGSTAIIYSVGAGCTTSIPVSIATIAASDTITGPDAVCVGASITLRCDTRGHVELQRSYCHG